MERWKKMMDSMINFITVSSELVEKLNNKLDGKSVSVNKASKGETRLHFRTILM